MIEGGMGGPRRTAAVAADLFTWRDGADIVRVVSPLFQARAPALAESRGLRRGQTLRALRLRIFPPDLPS